MTWKALRLEKDWYSIRAQITSFTSILYNLILWWNLWILSFLRYRDRSVQFVKLSVFLWVCFPSWFYNCLFDCLIVKDSFAPQQVMTRHLRSMGRERRWKFKISNWSMLKLVIQRWNSCWNFIKQRILFFNTFLRIATLFHGQVVPSIWHKTEKHFWKHLKHWTDGERKQQHQNRWKAWFMKENCAFGRCR